MAQYNSTDYTAQLAGRKVAAAPGLREALYTARAQVAVDTSLAANDVLNFFYLPDGAVVEDMELIPDDLDSGGPTITINVGDAGSATRYFNAATGAGTGTRNKMLQSAMGYQISGKTLIFGTIQAAATTKVAGNVTLVAYYKMPGKAVS